MNKLSLRIAVSVAAILFISVSVSEVTPEVEPIAGQDEPMFELNLEDVDIRVLADQVAEVTGKNIVIDQRVDASVTAMLDAPLKLDQLYEVFLSIAAVHDVNVINVDENTLLLVPKGLIVLESTVENIRNQNSASLR